MNASQRLLLGLLLVASGAAAAEDRKATPPSLDDQLLKRLEAESMDPLDRSLLQPEKQPGKPAEAKPNDPVQPLLDQLGPAGASENDPPMIRVAKQMHEAQLRLARSDAGRPTQDLQRQVIAELDKLIRQARQQSRSSASAGQEAPLPTARRQQAQPQQPAQQSKAADPKMKPSSDSQMRTTAPTEPRRADAESLQASLKALWGDLPEKAREQMLQQFRVEEFLPQYEAMLEAYFRRLAEQPEPAP